MRLPGVPVNLLAYLPGTRVEVRNSPAAHVHPATQADVEQWAANRDLVLIPKTEWLKLTAIPDLE